MGYSNLNLNTTTTTVECSKEITITITITDKNYNYSNLYEIFIIYESDYISVYADHTIDKQNIAQAIEYLISVGPTCRYSMPSLLAGVGQLSQLAKLCFQQSDSSVHFRAAQSLTAALCCTIAAQNSLYYFAPFYTRTLQPVATQAE